MERNGIAIAGSLIVDHIKEIKALPNRSELTKITSVSASTGGCVCNTGIDLTDLDPNLTVTAYGVIGDDGDGETILNVLNAAGMDTKNIVKRGTTSFTDVFSETENGCRTFFQFGGSNDLFSVEDVNVNEITAKVFHLGYLLLMNELDSADAEYGTKSARLLAKIKEQGVLTSIDIVSENSDRFKTVVIPALKYVDYLFINELEASKITDVPLAVTKNGIDEESVKLALTKLFDLGIGKRVIIHASCGAYGMDSDSTYSSLPSKDLKPGFIVGTVGAGDAFCAGALLASYRDLDLDTALLYGNAAAMMALTTATATGGVKEIDEAIEFYNNY